MQMMPTRSRAGVEREMLLVMLTNEPGGGSGCREDIDCSRRHTACSRSLNPWGDRQIWTLQPQGPVCPEVGVDQLYGLGAAQMLKGQA